LRLKARGGRPRQSGGSEGRSAVDGAHHRHRAEVAQGGVERSAHLVVAPVADDARRQEKLLVPQPLGEDVLDAAEAAVRAPTEEAAATLPVRDGLTRALTALVAETMPLRPDAGNLSPALLRPAPVMPLLTHALRMHRAPDGAAVVASEAGVSS
jgi:hypothetical protein